MDFESAGRRPTSRRGLLIGAGAAGAALLASGPALAGAPRRGASVRWLAFEHAWTGEKLKITYYENGRYIDGAIEAMDRIMRDHRTHTEVAMNPRLYDILFDLNRLMDSSQPYLIISGYRSPSTNAMLRSHSHAVAKHSYHMRGWAADIRLQGRDRRAVALGAVSLKRGGVGMYGGKSNFVHVDCGPVRHWNI
jgi:uncharacterized protein YcbK (DUF882 family)